jgi:hypothetical protein
MPHPAQRDDVSQGTTRHGLTNLVKTRGIEKSVAAKARLERYQMLRLGRGRCAGDRPRRRSLNLYPTGPWHQHVTPTRPARLTTGRGGKLRV